MTIRRGEDWGRLGRPPADLLWFDDDASAAAAVDGGRREIGLGGGDMARTLGVGSVESAVAFPIDLMEVSTSDGRRVAALSHVMIRNRRWSWWRGSIVVVMNAQFIGRWDVAPRGHPNDGRVEVVEVDASMPLRQRFLAGRRLPTGAHVPHPHIRTRSSTRYAITLPRKSRVMVDGRPWSGGSSSSDSTLTVSVVPDAFVAWIAGVR